MLLESSALLLGHLASTGVLCTSLSFMSCYFANTILQCFVIFFVLDETLSQASSATSASASGVYEIPARLRTLHNLVIQYASQVGIFVEFFFVLFMSSVI